MSHLRPERLIGESESTAFGVLSSHQNTACFFYSGKAYETNFKHILGAIY